VGVATTGLAGCLDRERVDLRVVNEDDADLQVRAGGSFDREAVLPPAGQGRPYDTTVTVDGGQTVRRSVDDDGMRTLRVTVRAPGDIAVRGTA
jgi:hypothetical protein